MNDNNLNSPINQSFHIGYIWPWLVLVLLIFLISTEYGSQDCREQRCHEKIPEIFPSDSKREIIDKVEFSSRKYYNLVLWRQALIISLISSVLILFICQKYIVSGFTFFLVAFFLFFVVYFTMLIFNEFSLKPKILQIEHDLEYLSYMYKQEEKDDYIRGGGKA